MLRLEQFASADTLADVMRLPGARCHPLTGDRRGQFAVDLQHPYRLVFEPATDPLPLLADGGLDLSRIASIVIVEVVDYHGE